MIINGKEYKFIIKEKNSLYYIRSATILAGIYPIAEMVVKNKAKRFETMDDAKKYLRKNKLKLKDHIIEVEEINND